jgi:hypothetical protein
MDRKLPRLVELVRWVMLAVRLVSPVDLRSSDCFDVDLGGLGLLISPLRPMSRLLDFSAIEDSTTIDFERDNGRLWEEDGFFSCVMVRIPSVFSSSEVSPK